MSDTYEMSELAVSVKNITKRVSKDIYGETELCGISFSFGKKGIHCILAPKNSGKTQIMDILAGCDKADEGEVCVLGSAPYGNADVKKKIGYVRKDNSLYSGMTAFELMSFVGEAKKIEQGKLYRQIKEALELVGLDEMRNKLLVKLNEYDRKKLLLAAALLGNPDLLLLDEPITVRMSAEHREELEEIIAMLGRIKTVIVTTDDCSIARALGEDVVIISDGRVLAKGSFESLDKKLAEADDPTTLETLYNTLTGAVAE